MASIRPTRFSAGMVAVFINVVLAAATALRSAPASTIEPAAHVDVVIIGAGWAGMAAADSLSRANVSFVVLESTNRTGGRSHAITFGDEKIWRGTGTAPPSFARTTHPSVPSQPPSSMHGAHRVPSLLVAYPPGTPRRHRHAQLCCSFRFNVHASQ